MNINKSVSLKFKFMQASLSVKVFLLILFLIVGCKENQQLEEKSTSYCQYNKCYYQNIEEGKKQFEERNFSTAYKFFNEALNECSKPLRYDAIWMAATCIKQKLPHESLSYMNIAIKNGLTVNDILDFMSNNEVNDSLVLASEDKLLKSGHQYKQIFDSTLSDSIRLYLRIDSLSRINEEWVVIEKTDKMLGLRLRSVLEELGELPSNQKLDWDDKTRLYALVLHALYHEENRGFYRKVMDELLLKGYTSPKMYRYAIHRSNAAQFLRDQYSESPDSVKAQVMNEMMIQALDPANTSPTDTFEDFMSCKK